MDKLEKEAFYNSLNEVQKERVENKLEQALSSGSQVIVDETSKNMLRLTIATDMYKVLKG